MITGQIFIALARRRLQPLVKRFNLHDSGSIVDPAYAELQLVGRSVSLDIGMDRAEDYRVYARIGRLDRQGQRREPVLHPKSPSDFNEFDLQLVLAEAGRSWRDLGAYDKGSREDVDRALSDVLTALEEHASRLLGGVEGEWHRLGRVMAQRVRDEEAR